MLFHERQTSLKYIFALEYPDIEFLVCALVAYLPADADQIGNWSCFVIEEYCGPLLLTTVAGMPLPDYTAFTAVADVSFFNFDVIVHQ